MTRMRADQQKILPPPRMHKPNATVYYYKKL